MKLQEGNVFSSVCLYVHREVGGDHCVTTTWTCWNLLTWRPGPNPTPSSRPWSWPRPPSNHLTGSPCFIPSLTPPITTRGPPYLRPLPSDIFKTGTSWKTGGWPSTERPSCYWIKESSVEGNRSCVWHSWSKNKHNPCAAIVLCEENQWLYCFHGFFHTLLHSTAYEQFALHYFISAKKIVDVFSCFLKYS